MFQEAWIHQFSGLNKCDPWTVERWEGMAQVSQEKRGLGQCLGNMTREGVRVRVRVRMRMPVTQLPWGQPFYLLLRYS